MIDVLSVLFLLICFGSVITSFVAIFQILYYDFNGSKGLWIIISMIAFVGPLLYLIKGRKLLMKRASNQSITNEKFSLKSHYVDLIKDLNSKVKISFYIAIGLIIIGYLVQIFDIYIFWESKTIGYAILMLCIALLLSKDITIRKRLKLKTVWSYIAFWLIVFILFVKTLIVIILPNSEACIAAEKYLNNDSELFAEIGTIKGYTILPNGGIQSTTDSEGTYGAATINMIIKGSKKYVERIVYLEKTPEYDWVVIGIE